MATPEQNTLLALQLFGAPAQQFNQQNDTRTNLLYKLMAAKQDEDLKRELATQGYDKSIELAKMTADREDSRQLGSERRQASQLTALQTREDSRDASALEREKSRSDAADTKQLRNTIASTYPKYAAEATRLGEKVRAITDFEETWEGLGELQAEMARLEQSRVLRDQNAASDAAVGELDDAVAAVAEHKKALEDAGKPHPEDEKYARARAADAVRQAIEAGGVTSAPKANSKAATNGLAALIRGDVTEAGKLLGSEVLNSFDNAYEAAIQAAPNFKSRMQQYAVAQQNYQLAQRNLSTIQSDLRKAAAGNNSLATKLTTRRSALQQLMGPDDSAGAPARRTFEQLTPPPGAPAGAGTPAPNGGTSALQMSPDNLFGGLQDLGVFDRPMVQIGRNRSYAPVTPELAQSAREKLQAEMDRVRGLNSRGAPNRLLELQRLSDPLNSILAPANN